MAGSGSPDCPRGDRARFYLTGDIWARRFPEHALMRAASATRKEGFYVLLSIPAANIRKPALDRYWGQRKADAFKNHERETHTHPELQEEKTNTTKRPSDQNDQTKTTNTKKRATRRNS